MRLVDPGWTAVILSDLVSVNTLLVFGIVILLVTAGVLLLGKGKGRQAIKNIALSDLSVLWTKEGTKVIHIAELSPLWRDSALTAVPEEPVDLRHGRAAAFMEKYILSGPWFQKAPMQKSVCRGILELLDREGDCSSVVNVSKDVEGSWDENTFRILSRTSLLDHTLNVAEQVVQLLSKAEAWHVIPDTMVAALGHDLGKLETMRGYLYSLGEHPMAAGRPLAGIPGFKDLPKTEEISRAIKLHHKSVDGLLAKTLKKADQRARQKELEETVERLPPAPDVQETPFVPPVGALAKEETATDSSNETQPLREEDAAAARQAQTDIFDEESPAPDKAKLGEIPARMNILSWFDADAFLRELKPYVNRMFGRRFMAFSMPDGHVYFQVKVLEEVARKQAERAGAMEIATMAANDTDMRRVLFSIVQHLQTEHDVIARGLIKENFFGGYFMVSKKTGKAMKGYYTPFHAEAFGSIAEMEQAKSETLKNFQAVKPYLHDENNTPAENFL